MHHRHHMKLEDFIALVIVLTGITAAYRLLRYLMGSKKI